MDCTNSPRRTSGAVNVWLAPGFTAVLVIALGLLSFREIDWFLLKHSLRSKFGGENWITTQQLADWLVDNNRPAPVLLDVRTPAEWKVSHLPGARLVDPKADAKTAAGDLPKDAPIVTYCAVGYRSGVMAQRLRAAGYAKVQNLEGSIFQWANEHRPLMRDGKRVTQVHPYSASRGRLLEPDVRAPLPQE
jgi:rhodanese-related sulfurtransferase